MRLAVYCCFIVRGFSLTIISWDMLAYDTASISVRYISVMSYMFFKETIQGVYCGTFFGKIIQEVGLWQDTHLAMRGSGPIRLLYLLRNSIHIVGKVIKKIDLNEDFCMPGANILSKHCSKRLRKLT